MDPLNSAGLGVRRNEDIALDLLKFVAGTAGVGRPVAGSDRIQRLGRGQARRACEPAARALRPLPEGGGRQKGRAQ